MAIPVPGIAVTLLEPELRSVELPPGSQIASIYGTTHLADAYAVTLPRGTVRDPEALARFLFAQQPAWVGLLMGLRDMLVAGLGLKTARQLGSSQAAGRNRRIGIFRIYETTTYEIILGEDDQHLDFRVSVMVRPDSTRPADAAELVVATVVHCHNRLGRTYIRLIAPFHRRVVKAGLRQASRAGWPTEAGA